MDKDMRVSQHPILGAQQGAEKKIHITVDGKEIEAIDGEPIAAALYAAGIRTFRYTEKQHKPRSIFCAIGRCTDCAMIVDGVPYTRTCVTKARDGMVVETRMEPENGEENPYESTYRIRHYRRWPRRTVCGIGTCQTRWESQCVR